MTRVGSGQVWITRWQTDGHELPFDADWLWYAAIIAVAAAAKADHRIRFQSPREVQRLATQVGAGNWGGAMRKRMTDAIRRLGQAKFGWAKSEIGNGNTLASQQLRTEPILSISSALAAVLWPDGCPMGIQVGQDDINLWIEPTVAHLVMALETPFKVPLAIFQALATRPQMMSLTLVIAAYSQAASRPLILGRATWEILLTRNFQAPATLKEGSTVKHPIERARKRVMDATAWLDQACSKAGFSGAVRLYDPTRANAYGHPIAQTSTQHISELEEKKIYEPGRPKERWLLAIMPAKPPFVRS